MSVKQGGLSDIAAWIPSHTDRSVAKTLGSELKLQNSQQNHKNYRLENKGISGKVVAGKSFNHWQHENILV